MYDINLRDYHSELVPTGGFTWQRNPFVVKKTHTTKKKSLSCKGFITGILSLTPCRLLRGKGPLKYPLQWFLHWALQFYALVSLLGGGTNTKCCLPVLGD